jgi:hypothetical protein
MATVIPVALAPSPGLCVKTSSLQPGVYSAGTDTVPVSIGLKVFVNICWDKNIPAPPVGSEDAIERAMQGEDVGDQSLWFVPIVVSDGRPVTDKGVFWAHLPQPPS